ncbi:MAG: hypothetical protein AB7E29_01835 [Xanthobacter sp.]
MVHWFGPIAAAILLVLPWAAMRLTARYKANRIFRQQKSLHPLVTLTWTDVDTQWQSAGGSVHVP